MMRIKNIDPYFYFVIFWGVIATLWKYSFGTGDQLDHLLFLFKRQDPSFLLHDFYVKAIDGFNVRTYFTLLVFYLSRLFSVEGIYFLLTLISNVLLALSSFLVTKTVSKNSFSGAVAALLATTLTLIYMGDGYTLYAKGLTPAALSFALVLWAMYCAIINKLYCSMLVCGLASLIHISLGAIGGLLILVAFAIHQWETLRWLGFIKSAVILLIFSLFTLIPFYLQKGEPLDESVFMQIYVHFRAPHHLLFSDVFTLQTTVRVLFFMMGSIIAGLLLYRDKVISTSHILFLGAIVAGVIDINIIGYFLVEVFDSRWGAILQAMRYFSFLKFIVLVFIAAYIGHLVKSKHWLRALYVSISLLSPILLGFVMVFELCVRHYKKAVWLQYLGLLLVACYWFAKQANPETIVYFIGIALLLSLRFLSYRVSVPIIGLYAFFVLSNAFYNSKGHFKKYALQQWLDVNYRPTFAFALDDDLQTVCQYLRQQTPYDAVVLAPPNLVEIRAVAHRASVSCFKTLPFKEQYMFAWKERLDFCYGNTIKTGFMAEEDLRQNYAQINDLKITQIHHKYNAQYAVLYTATPCALPLLFANSSYKIMAIK